MLRVVCGGGVASRRGVAAAAATTMTLARRTRSATAATKDDGDGDVTRVSSVRCYTRADVGPDTNYAGWGSAAQVPTRDDVREILRYVPVNWGSIGSLNIPAAVRRRHVRTASLLMWLRRQPAYFEVRDIDGTLEVRRSVVLHPAAHGLTPEQAREQLARAVRAGVANDLAPVAPGAIASDSAAAAAEAAADNAPVAHTRATRQLLRALCRMCPAYFVTAGLLLPRCANKNVTAAALLELVRLHPGEFEVLALRYADEPLLRRRAGVDSARWRDDFCADVARYPGDVRALLPLLRHTCALWDRPEYVYARLTPDERATVGGYAAMCALLARHPRVWRVGAHFVCRVDAADPTAPSSQPREPAPDEMTSRALCCAVNPYLSLAELARVFHYAAPDDEACTAAFFVRCASPAMRVVLPPRVTDVLQAFPDLFACRETTPGVFVARKLRSGGVARTTAATRRENDGRDKSGDDNNSDAKTTGADGNTAAADIDNSWQDEERQLCDDAHVRRDDVVAAVAALVPDDGVEAAHLLLWASLALQRAATRFAGGVLKLAETTPSHFRVVDNGRVKMIYRAQPL